VSVSLIAGLFQLLMFICRLGVVATYMSSPFIGGFMTGSAVQIMVSQVIKSLAVINVMPV
jgi:MFS superfamily sulfate permease-like transporter